jgi:DNA repair protein RadC
MDRPALTNWDRLMAYLNAALAHERVEQFHVRFPDDRNRLLGEEAQSRGTAHHTPVYPREVVTRALELRATAPILARNHPNGSPTPAKADLEMTREIRLAEETLSIVLPDRIIISITEWIGFRREGLL